MSNKPIRVLIIDDCADDRTCIRELLHEGPEGKAKEIVVFEVDTGQAGHAFCGKDPPHCILLGHSLPDETGIQFLAKLRNGSAKHALPAVIFLAANGSEAVAAEAMRQGAADFVVKGTMTAADLRHSVRKAVAGVKRHQRSVKTHHELTHAKAQLHAAGEVQSMLLPERAPDVPGLDIAGACFPADESGGDFYDYPKMLDGSVGIVIGDVSGHGLGPAILAADSRAYVRAFSRTCNSLGEVLVQTNHLLCEDTKGERFVTLFFACIHPETRVLRVASAGHQAFLFDRHGFPSALESQQPPLGLAPKFIRNFESTMMLRAGELLLLMTDGISEAASTRDVPRCKATMFGDQRALEIVRDCRHESSAKIAEILINRARDFTHRPYQDDDMTVVVVKVLDC